MDYSVPSYGERNRVSINSTLLGFFGWVTLIILAIVIGTNMITGQLMIQLPYFGPAVTSVLGFVLIIVTFLGVLFNIFGKS